MAGVLDRLGRSKKHPVEPSIPAKLRSKDRSMLELQAAKEILSEVFAITIPEVDEMIRLRSEERMLWPERFWIEE